MTPDGRDLGRHPPGLLAFRRLAADLAEVPLLLVATARDGAEHEEGWRRSSPTPGKASTSRLRLAPSTTMGSRSWCPHIWPARWVSPDLVASLVARGGGNPFATLEYLRALVDAGALSPR